MAQLQSVRLEIEGTLVRDSQETLCCVLEQDTSYMSANVLLNLLKKLRNEFDKLNNTEARMLDSIYHMTLILLKNHIFGVKTSKFCHLLYNVIMDVITLRY